MVHRLQHDGDDEGGMSSCVVSGTIVGACRKARALVSSVFCIAEALSLRLHRVPRGADCGRRRKARTHVFSWFPLYGRRDYVSLYNASVKNTELKICKAKRAVGGDDDDDVADTCP